VLGSFIYLRSQVPSWPEPLKDTRVELVDPLLNPDEVTKENAFYYLTQIKPVVVDESSMSEKEFARHNTINEKEMDILDFFLENGFTGEEPILDALVHRERSNIELFLQAGRCSVSTGVKVKMIKPSKINTHTNFPIPLLAFYDITKGVISGTRSPLDYNALFNAVAYTTSEGSLVQYAMSLGGYNLLLPAIPRSCDHEKVDALMLKQLSKALLSSEKSLIDFGEIMKVENIISKGLIDNVYDELKVSSMSKMLGLPETEARPLWLYAVLGSTAKDTKENLEPLYQRMIALSESPTKTSSIRLITEVTTFIDESTATPFYTSLSDDPIGRLLATMLIPAMIPLQVKAQELKAKLRATSVYAAVKAYQKDKGTLPGKLSQLVPEYFDSIPMDPHSGNTQPLQYSVTDDSHFSIYTIKGNYPYSDREHSKQYTLSSKHLDKPQ